MGSDPPVDGRRARESVAASHSTNTACCVGLSPSRAWPFGYTWLTDYTVPHCGNMPQQCICFGDTVICGCVCIRRASIGLWLYLGWLSLHARTWFGRLARLLQFPATSERMDAIECRLLHGINICVLVCEQRREKLRFFYCVPLCCLKGTVHLKIKNTYFSSYIKCYLSV